MKISHRLIFGAVLMAVGHPAWAGFDWFGGRLSIGGGYGRTSPRLPYAYKDTHEDGQIWTARVNYFLTDRFSLVGSYADLQVNEKAQVQQDRFRPIIGSLRANLLRGVPVTPYLTAGAGVSRNQKEVAGAPNITWTKFAAQGGVGLEFFVNQGTSFGAEALYHHFVAENSRKDYGVASLVGTVNVYFGDGPATRQAAEKARAAELDAERRAQEAARAKAEAEAALAQAQASQRAAEESAREARAMQERAAQAQRELDEIKKMVERKDISPVNFETGKAALTADSFGTLDRVVEIVKKYPDLKLQVEGHTDSVGGDALNLRLSQARAESVRDYMVSQGVSGSQIKAVGFGETRPIADNGTAEGRQKNRRVEFLFTLN